MTSYQGPSWAPVQGAGSACGQGGCQLAQAQQILARAADALAEFRKDHMSAALWCDAGGHAFSERDPGRQRISVNALDEDTGKESFEARDFCGACAEAAGLLKRRTRPAAAAATPARDPGHYDPALTRQLEAQAGIPPLPDVGRTP